ncbi:uncharacterized protein PHALS_01296 [Plasmopara halstedii]|uniref:Uncharacterized protein n=1 Tax=Plasmopara halstedii TaxID=4781 RepID=A0A0P1ASK6_PLAHL|nr:uncharacterized protein PHALS_01296 [Plasmopara halstedii]CEG44973.1 hypothetical protein PHALS_01296 [Plasmopara halstedii]|eukprot:XP_024581342.1 hypothetical protein PHALS_01296 [Plasmopara halstedii]
MYHANHAGRGCFESLIGGKLTSETNKKKKSISRVLFHATIWLQKHDFFFN